MKILEQEMAEAAREAKRLAAEEMEKDQNGNGDLQSPEASQEHPRKFTKICGNERKSALRSEISTRIGANWREFPLISRSDPISLRTSTSTPRLQNLILG